MDRRVNFVQGMYPEDIHFNGMQDSIEAADKRIANAIAGKGIISGFEFSISEDTAFITPGEGVDGLGQQVHYSGAALEIDLSEIERPGPGNYKWISFYVAFSQYSHDDVYDDNNVRYDLYTDEGIEVGYIEGIEGTTENAEQPPIGNNILVADLLIDSSSPFNTFTPSYIRREKIPTVIDLKNRVLIANVIIDDDAKKIITFENLGLPAGNYSVFGQIHGLNTKFIRHLALDKTETAITLFLYHDNYPYTAPALGAPPVKIGMKKVDSFIIGGRDPIAIDLFIRKEKL